MDTNVYTHGHHESVLRSHRWRTAENSAAYLLPVLTDAMVVLDVGAGPATITRDLAARVANVVALEVNAEAVAVAREGLAGVPNAAVALGDVHALPFPDDTFCVVHAHQVLQHVADPVLALREMRRVCKPGGYVAARDGDYAAFTWYPQLPELDDWLALYQRLARANGGEPDAGRRLLAWAHAAGFSEVTATSSTWCFADDEDRAWWGGMWADRVRESAMARQALASGVPQEELDRISAGWTRWAGDPDGWLSILHGEILARP
ncbi:methyltransferase domain-containing protein [Dactylosporangium vinaceum]|uniref:Class I SAM-dependent methyltransferase n=1 Tax=Dactylosporangium vinaceum TaxID=53362 RepID=A0ABV5MGH0_9ACTN|nr:class I SAM-dependent methyltransferase [Dactylosporangium vinaceum]UAB99004.1 methyltransferase domain-containing protein [Dactylosporangium vinaceum]